MARDMIELKYRVGERIVTVRAFETVATEDCYELQLKAVLHRYVTGEDVIPSITREVKDAIIKQGLFI